MFFRFLAIFLILPVICFGQNITKCNAFGGGAACEDGLNVDDFEVVEEVLIEKKSAGPRGARAINQRRVGNACSAADGSECGPVFVRNKGKCGDDGSECGPIFKRNENCEKCEEPKEEVYVKNYTPAIELDYDSVHRDCNDFLPVNFSYVDFRLKDKNKFADYMTKLGDYRFRIFGCRRNDKEMFLNVGRTMQKDMDFFEVFNDVYGSCIPQQSMPLDLCDENANTPMPEYILTAEIVDYAMNVCDEFDWKTVKNKEKRSGTSEMTVVWRLMDVSKQKVFWKGESTGYAELGNGVVDGEVELVEESFRDALVQLRYLEGFEKQVATRLSSEEKMASRKMLADLEKVMNPAKCDYEESILASIVEKNEDCKCECPCESSSIISEIVDEDLTGVCNSENGCGPIFERNKGKCGEDGSGCGPIFKRNENCDSVGCRLFAKNKEGACGEKGDCGQIFKRNAGCDNCEEFEIDEASGIDSFGNIDTVRYIESDWVGIEVSEDKEEIIEAAYLETQGEFCIENDLVNKEMNPYNVYKTRASIVEISSLTGKKEGVGLIINDQFILTSAALIGKDDNNFTVKTINGVEFGASGFRFSPSKNVALLIADEKIEYTPLPLQLELPPVGATGFMTMGMSNQEEGSVEGYVDGDTTIAGYRYSKEKGAEIITNQHTQSLTVGGALVDDKGNIYGIAHYGKRYDDGADMYMPIEIALKSLSVELCGRDFLNQEPWKKSSVETAKQKAPEEMEEVERK